MVKQDRYSSAMNWVSGFLGRRASTPQPLPYGMPSDSNQTNGDGSFYTTSKPNHCLIGQHSLDQSPFDRFNEYKKEPKRRWTLQPDYIVPDMIGNSTLLTDDEIIFLDEEKPERLVGCTWDLMFSTELHGFLLSTLYRKVKSWSGPTLLVVKDKRGHRFGAFVTESFKPDDKIHGGGECFVFRLKHKCSEKLFEDAKSKEEESAMGDPQNYSKQAGPDVLRTRSRLSQKNDLSTLNDLIVREEHFSPEDKVNENVDVSFSGSTYSTNTDLQTTTISKESDIINNLNVSEFEEKLKINSTAHSLEQKKKSQFLEQYDLTEHYVWVWAGENSCFIHGDEKFLQLGLDDGKVALNIDNMLEKGRSQSTKVFDNEPLAPSLCDKDGDFEIVAMEIWSFKQL
jgi:hypothetical protein